MKTEELIRGLAADSAPPTGLGAGLLRALCLGGALSLALTLGGLGLRSGMPGLLMTPQVAFKFAATVPLALIAGLLVIRLSQPGARIAPAAALLALPVLILAAGAGTALATTPAPSWLPGLVGTNALYCLAVIPVVSAPLLAAALIALRRGAPTHPARAGAIAGLAAGALGGALYALHCTDDSPFFLITWYGLAIAGVTAIGALAGRRLLAW